ncbi:MAG TPA: ScpA family protein [Methanocellaceae archaeon]|jgi:segregation and condensation protein A
METETQSQPKEESIEILLELAKNGEIDPWNIDIIDITDKFLKRISDPDLRASGRTLLYASILLRMKSDILVNAPPQEEEFYDEPYEVNQEDYPLLEPRLRNVAARPVTLQELINELQRAVATKDLAHMRKSIKLERPPRKTLEEVLSLAHNEDIERSILDMTAILDTEFAYREFVMFSELVKDNTPHGIVDIYLPLLFLATRKYITLTQEVIFEDIFIRRSTKLG